MSRRTYSDICKNVVRLGNVSLPFKGFGEEDLQENWSLVYSAFEAGKKNRLICSYCFAKIKNDKLHVVCVLNSSEFAAGGDQDWTLFTNGNSFEVLQDLKNNNLDEECPLKWQDGLSCATDVESVNLFLSDFNWSDKEILDIVAVQQTI